MFKQFKADILANKGQMIRKMGLRMRLVNCNNLTLMLFRSGSSGQELRMRSRVLMLYFLLGPLLTDIGTLTPLRLRVLD
jgi:hypothetical protein